LVKSVRTWNASDEVNILIDSEAPKGKGFSAWANDKILKGSIFEKHPPTIKESLELENVELEL